MEKKLKVLLVTNMYPIENNPYYGIFVKEQIDAIMSLHPNVEYEVYFIKGGGMLGGGLLRSLKNYLLSILLVSRKISKGHFNIVHIHYGLSGLFVFNPLRKKIPTILTLHGGDILVEQTSQFQVNITCGIINRVSHTIVLNERMENIVRKYTNNLSVIPCAVDTGTFFPPQVRRSNTIPLIVFPSSRSRQVKNYPLFQETIELMRDKYNIACETCEIDGMSRNEINLLFQKADLLLMTSISEGSPQVVKEAMACDLPVVSTPVGDVQTLLRGVMNCAVASSHDKEELAKLCMYSLSKKIDGMPGSKKIVQLGLSKQSVADKVYNIYCQLVR